MELLNVILSASDGEYSVSERVNILLTKPFVVSDSASVVSGSDGADELFSVEGENIVLAGAGDDTANYNEDSIWGGFWSALNTYSGDLVRIQGKCRSYDAFCGDEGSDILNLSNKSEAFFLDDMYSANPNENGSRLRDIEQINAGAGDDVVDLTSYSMKYGDITINGGMGNDVIWGNDGDDRLEGGSGEDNIQGGAGNDLMLGGSDADIIKGFNGDDTLVGNTGNDYLAGDAGSDKYLFNKGDGLDTVNDVGAGLDTIKFGDEVEKDLIALFMDGNNLCVGYGDGNDQITVRDQVVEGSGIEKIELSDGSFLTGEDINRLIQDMSVYAEDNGLDFSGVEDVKRNRELMNIVSGGWV
jgi:Ca2+-binding RTX toxin-like protein